MASLVTADLYVLPVTVAGRPVTYLDAGMGQSGEYLMTRHDVLFIVLGEAPTKGECRLGILRVLAAWAVDGSGLRRPRRWAACPEPLQCRSDCRPGHGGVAGCVSSQVSPTPSMSPATSPASPGHGVGGRDHRDAYAAADSRALTIPEWPWRRPMPAMSTRASKPSSLRGSATRS